VNLAELYFESLEGMGNASRFTPMNDDVRALFRQQAGFDPIELFGAAQRRRFAQSSSSTSAPISRRRMQEEWLGELESVRREKPQLDLVLTHVDDRFDTGMRDAIGADAARVLPAAQLAQLHLPDRRSGDGLESGRAALPGDRRAVSASSRHTPRNWPSISISSTVTKMFTLPSSRPAPSSFNWCTRLPATFSGWRCTSRTRCCRRI
jgi:hypothetical protein